MSADHHPRYVVREITGYSPQAGSYRQSTSVWVADTWDCWREVRTYFAFAGFGCELLPTRRARAEQLCAELNAEHDAWLACA